MSENAPRKGDKIRVVIEGEVTYIDKTYVIVDGYDYDIGVPGASVEILSRKQVEVGEEISDIETLNNLPYGSIVWAGQGFLPGYCEGVDTWIFPGKPARHNSATLLWGNRTVKVLALGENKAVNV